MVKPENVHVLAGKVIGQSECGASDKGCEASVNLVVGRRGNIYKTCPACDSKVFYGYALSQELIAKHEAKKAKAFKASEDHKKATTANDNSIETPKQEGNHADYDDMWA